MAVLFIKIGYVWRVKFRVVYEEVGVFDSTLI